LPNSVLVGAHTAFIQYHGARGGKLVSVRAAIQRNVVAGRVRVKKMGECVRGAMYGTTVPSNV